MENENLVCRKKAMSLLNYRDRTEWELRDKLSTAGFGEEEVEDAVEYVRSFHYLDDQRFAVRYVETYQERRSIKRIRQELKNKHVREEYIEAALEETVADDSSAIRRELKKRIGENRELSELSEKERQKIAMGLYRKGFRTSDIFREMEALSLHFTR